MDHEVVVGFTTWYIWVPRWWCPLSIINSGAVGVSVVVVVHDETRISMRILDSLSTGSQSMRSRDGNVAGNVPR